MSTINLFSQVISKIDRNSFKKLVQEKQTDKYQKGCDSWTHLVSMLFCQFSKSQSVRDISNGLRSATGNLNHMGNNIQFESVKENDLPEDRHQHILKDELIQLTGNQTKKKYPERLRRIAIWDEQHQQTIELITNQMSRTANTVSEL